MVQIKRQSMGGEMTQLEKRLLLRHEDVGVQSPRIHIKGWMWQVHTYNTNTAEVETGGSMGFTGQFS